MYATTELAGPAASTVVEPPKMAGDGTTRVTDSTAGMLRRTITTDTPAESRQPINYADLERRANELRAEYIAALARRCYAAIGRALRQKDSQSRFIWP